MSMMKQAADASTEGTVSSRSLPSSDSDESHSTSSDEWPLVTVSEGDEGEARDTVSPLPKGFPPARMPSFKVLSSPIPSLELLNPLPDSHLRKSNMFAATFNLIATIVGGGVLSMPLSLAKSGLVLGTFLMIFAAVITDFSLYILCACARKTGATSYGVVARHAFGPGLEVLTTGIIFSYLFLVLIAFMVLVKGIWAPIIMVFLKCLWKDMETGERADDLVLLATIIFTMPFFLSRDLHGLRHSCFASFASITILCVAMIYRAWQKNAEDPDLFSNEALFVTSNVADALFSYPIIALAFVSSFNVIEVHCALVDPSRKRVQTVIHGAVFWSFVLMYIFSLAGYFYSYDKTDGNILLNFDPSDKVVFLGRIGCGVCTLLAMPMSLLPCRDALLTLPTRFLEWKKLRAMTKINTTSNSISEEICSPVQEMGHHNEQSRNCFIIDEEQRPLLNNCKPPFSPNGQNFYSSTETTKIAIQSIHPSVSTNDKVDHFSLHNKILHWAATLGILSICYVGAVLAPGVAIVWSIVGSSLAFLVQYILPAACYLKLRASKKRKRGHACFYIFFSWVLLAISCAGAVSCTAQTVWRIFFMDKE